MRCWQVHKFHITFALEQGQRMNTQCCFDTGHQIQWGIVTELQTKSLSHYLTQFSNGCTLVARHALQYLHTFTIDLGVFVQRVHLIDLLICQIHRCIGFVSNPAIRCISNGCLDILINVHCTFFCIEVLHHVVHLKVHIACEPLEVGLHGWKPRLQAISHVLQSRLLLIRQLVGFTQIKVILDVDGLVLPSRQEILDCHQWAIGQVVLTDTRLFEILGNQIDCLEHFTDCGDLSIDCCKRILDILAEQTQDTLGCLVFYILFSPICCFFRSSRCSSTSSRAFAGSFLIFRSNGLVVTGGVGFFII